MRRSLSFFFAAAVASAAVLFVPAMAETAGPAQSGAVRTISVQALKDLQKRKVMFYLIDVRQPAEFSGGHIAGAISMPLDTLPNTFRNIPRGVKLVVYCLSGVRSASAVAFLQARGYTKAVSLAGGYKAWQGL